MKYTIYTDGAYSIKHNEGAFAFIILNENEQVVGRYAQKIVNETNNRAELKAIMAAVFKLPDDATEVIVKSDSQYALNTLFGNWKREKNTDLFEIWKTRILSDRLLVDFTPEWVPGHAGHYYNELCDQMCNDVLGYDANAEFRAYSDWKKAKKKQST